VRVVAEHDARPLGEQLHPSRHLWGGRQPGHHLVQRDAQSQRAG
jgi:hypothetical protein